MKRKKRSLFDRITDSLVKGIDVSKDVTPLPRHEAKLALGYTVRHGLRSVVVGLAGVMALAGCGGPETKRELSDTLHEDGKVTELIYTPSTHGSGTSVGPTMDLDGNLGVSVQNVSIHTLEKYGLVFECGHGNFVVIADGDKYKGLWSRLKKGTDVDITYKEVFDVVYDDIDGDGDREVIEKKLMKYDFIDAVPKKK